MSKVYVIAGPTASGKSALAVQLAHKIGGEIVSADSMQVYKGMNIGTAKPNTQEMQGIPHHMIDVACPHRGFSVAEYTSLATAAVEDILARQLVPIVVGGTGFYINALIYGVQFAPGAECKDDSQLRQYFTQLAAQEGASFLHAKLHDIDSAAAQNIHPNNIKRVVRALSFCKATGELFSAHNAAQKQNKPRYSTEFYVLDMPREMLYARINARVLQMWESGLAAEVSSLLAQGLNPNCTAMQGIGYKEVVPYVQGYKSKADTIESLQQATRNYAKRQDTWFRHQVSMARKINVESATLEEIVKNVL